MVSTIEEWLALLGMSEYTERFIEDDIDLDVLGELTDQDFDRLGVSVGHRRRMLRAIRERRGSAPAAPQSATASSTPQDSAERRQLTVMFCDLVGSTALSAKLDPEDLREVIGAYHRCCAEQIAKSGGFVARYLGDGVLAYFGYPQVREHDAERAVRSGLALVEAVPKLDAGAGTSLQVRVGIATGLVVVGDLIGVGAAQEQGVIGETPNLAARLQAVAEPSAVVISSSTRRLIGGLFEYRDLGTVALKGFAEDVPTWQVLGAGAAESRFEALRATTTPLVGRDEEIDLLLRRWEQAKRGEGCVVLVSGEPGIGKSRIAQDVVARLGRDPHTRLRYFCSPHHQDSAFYPSISQLERAAGFGRHDTDEQRLIKLEAVLAQGANDLNQVIPPLADLLSIPTGDRYPPLNLTPQKRKEKMLHAQLAQVEGLAARQPVLMVWEDVHWSDPTTRESLDLLIDRAATLRVLVIITFRPEFTPSWIGRPHVTLLSLSRLPRKQRAVMMSHVTGGKPLPKEIADQIVDRTDGVPLFIEELTKTVIESGILVETADGYAATRPVAPLTIPTTLQDSLLARLDRLAPVREVAQTGAALGRQFSHELISAVAAMPQQQLDDALTELARAELVFRRGIPPNAEYTFKHSLVQEAAYGTLLRSRRQQLHCRIAGVLEERFPEIAQMRPEVLAHHFTEGGLIKKASEYWLQAGKNAALRSANLEAIAHLERGLAVTNSLPVGQEKDQSELDLQLVLGPCLITTYGAAASKAVETFARARELCERLGEPPEYLQVMFWLATASVVRGELPQALEAIAGLPSAAEARGNQPTLLNGIRGQAMILMFMGRIVEARRTLERAVEAFSASQEADQIATRAAGQDAGVSMLVLMAWVSWLLGHVDEAVSRMTAALERADAVEHAHTQAYAWYYASVLHVLCGEPAIAQSYAERCLATSEQHGFRNWLGLSRAIRHICASGLDASAGPLDEVMAVLDEYQRAGYRLGVTVQLALLCPILLLRHEPEAALEVVDHGLSIVSHNSERLFEAELYRLKARALLMRGASDADVESMLAQALQTARDQEARSLELRTAIDIARLWMRQGKRSEAFDLLSPIYSWFTEGFDTLDLKQARALLDELASS